MTISPLLKTALACLSLSLGAFASEKITLNHRGPKKPFSRIAQFKDHTMSLFATSPEVNYPVSVIAEPGGALYALCDENAAVDRRPHQGSVLRLIDKNNDGKADYMTKFIADVDTPRGGQFLDDTLYLVHPPYISAYRDTNGDGVADEHKVLASGFGHDLKWKRGGDHTTNDLRIGIDGWIYVAIGDFGASAVGSDGSKVKLLGGGVIRMRLDGSDLELYTRGTRNTYDLAINHKMDLIALDNTNDGDGWDMRLHHLTPLAHMGYPNLFKYFSEDTMPPLFDFGGGAGCGALFLQEPGFPEWLNNRFSTISWGNIYTHDLTANEATFTCVPKHTLKMVKMLDLDVDGSSRLYFANFDNGGARTPQGSSIGRIILAKPQGWTYKAFPNLKRAKTADLISYLDRGSNVLRHNAQSKLIESKDTNIDSKLLKAVNNNATSLEARIAALYAINLRNKSNTVTVLKNILNNDDLREYALRALIDRQDRSELGLESTVAAYLTHPNARIRLQAIVAAQKLDLKKLTKQLLSMSDDSKKRTPLVRSIAHVHQATPPTARRALIQMQPVDELHQYLSDATLRTAALAVLNQIHHKENVVKLIAALKQTSVVTEKLEIVAVLMRLFKREHNWDGDSWWTTRPFSAGPYYLAASWEMSETIASALRKEV